MSKPAFEVDEEVLGFHGLLLYDAKVVKVDTKASPVTYFVHYRNWSKKWDEWVQEDRLVKHDEHGLAMQKRLEEEQRKKGKDGRGGKSKGTGKGAGKRKRGDPNVEPDEERMLRKEIKLTIPGPLKKRLVTDFEAICHGNKLVTLPREITVSDILRQFVDSKSRKAAQDKVVREMVDGLRVFFDRALGSVLLYCVERPQYYQIKQKHKDSLMSDIYGAEHLLRLFVKLPSLIAQTQMLDSQINLLQKHLTEFLRWMQKNPSFWTEKYETRSDEYNRETAPLVPSSSSGAEQATTTK